MQTPSHSFAKQFPAAFALLTFFILAGSDLNAQTTDSSVTAQPPADIVAAGKKADPPKITFDEKDPTIMYVETGGERYRVNSVTKLVEKIASTSTTTAPADQPTTAKLVQDDAKVDYYAYDAGDEPFSYRLVNVPTPKKVPKGTWNLNFSHRFSQPIQPLSESGKALLGFDSFSISSFGVSYGITDKFYMSASRSPICQRGLCRTIEIGAGYHITDQDDKSPLAISAYASIEGNENFSKQYNYNLQMMFARRFGKRVFAFFSPALHLNSNGGRRFNPRANDYFPTATAANTFKLPNNGASFGMGASVRITPSLMGIFEFTPRTGFKLGRVAPILSSNFNVLGFTNRSEPEMGIGLQYSIGKHAFTLTFSNTQTTTTSRYNSSNLVLSPRHLIIGFNLFRRW